MQPDLPRPAALTGSSSRRAVRVLFVSDYSVEGHSLHEAFDVTSTSFDQAEAALTGRVYEVTVVDARVEAHLHEVSKLALGGTRGVVVIGPPNNPADAMRYLDLGASDYVSSHATPTELIARVRAVARTAATDDDDPLTVGDVTISLRRREVRKRGEPVRLTPNEFAVLEVLAEEPGALVTHHKLMTRVWGPEYAEARHYLRLYIRQLREKLEDDPAMPRTVLTEWGAGYRLGDAQSARTTGERRPASA